MRVLRIDDRLLRTRVFALVILIQILLSCFVAATVFNEGKKQVLFIDSYAPGMVFSEQELNGVRDAFDRLDGSEELRVEYMDTKKVYDETHIQNLLSLYKHKYADIRFDVIIAADNAAFDFVIRYLDELFPDTPVVFLGVNYFSDDMLEGRTNITGVVQDIDSSSTIRVALTHFPDTKYIYIIHDQSDTGLAIRKQVESTLPNLDPVTIQYLTDMPLSDLLETIRLLPKESIILLEVFNRDSEGMIVTHEEIADLVSASTDLPIYVNSELKLNHGVIGGRITTGFEHGKMAGEMAVRILQGEPTFSIPIERESVKSWIFDYEKLSEYQIPKSLLPEGSSIINAPHEQEVPIWVIYIAGIIILSCFVIIVLLLYHINIRKKAENELILTIREKTEAEAHVRMDEARLEGLLRIYRYPENSVKKLLEYTLSECIHLTGSAFGYLFSYPVDQTGLLQVSESKAPEHMNDSSASPEMREKITGLMEEVASSRKAVIRNDIPGDGTAEDDLILNRYLATPVFIEDNVVLVLGVMNKETDYDDSDLRQITLMMDSVSQIIGRRKAVELLAEKTQFLQNIISHASIPIVVWNSRHVITEYNQALLRLLEKPADEVIDKDIRSVFIPADELQVSFLLDSIEEGTPWNNEEIPIFTTSGEVKNVTWNSSPVYFADGDLTAVIAMGIDVTEQKRLERERNSLIMQIERNLAELSLLNDGIRNPLTIISSLVEMDDPGYEEKIVREVMRIDQMVNQLDKRWAESEKIFSYLSKHYGIRSGADEKEGGKP